MHSSEATLHLPLRERFSWHALRSLGSLASTALIDQALVSGSNFLLGIVLARTLDPNQYGAFGVAFSVFLLLSLVHQSLILEPMGVFGPSQYADRLKQYVGTLLQIQTAVGVGTLMILALIAFCLTKISPSPALPSALAGMSFAAPCVLFFWLARRIFYLEMTPAFAIGGAVAYCAALVAGFIVVNNRHQLTAFTAFVVMGIASLIAGGLLILLFRPALWIHRATSGEVSLQHWTYGRWALAAAVMSWIPFNVYYSVLGRASGLAEAGALRAILNLTLPLAQGHLAFSLLLLPYASRMRKRAGDAHGFSLARDISLLYSGSALLYWLVILRFQNQIIDLLYHGNYFRIGQYLPQLALACILWAGIFGPAIVLRSMNLPSTVFAIYLGASILTVMVGVPAAWLFGIQGATWAMAASSLLAVSLAFFLLLRSLARQPAQAVAAQ